MTVIVFTVYPLFAVIVVVYALPLLIDVALLLVLQLVKLLVTVYVVAPLLPGTCKGHLNISTPLNFNIFSVAVSSTVKSLNVVLSLF